MTRAYSMDLRERVVDAVQLGATVREAATRFGVAISTVVKWTQRQRTTGSVAPKKVGGTAGLSYASKPAFSLSGGSLRSPISPSVPFRPNSWNKGSKSAMTRFGNASGTKS